jgi:hypothetical protein
MAADGGWQWTHAGALEGSNSAWLLRTPKSTIAFVFNTLPRDLDSFFGEIIPALQRELTSTTTWPTTDLFT